MPTSSGQHASEICADGGRRDAACEDSAVTLLVAADGRAVWRGRELRCAIGRGGIAARKTEGDGTTPGGRFPLRRVLYRADRTDRPRTGLPCGPIAPRDGWCDAPGDPRYNRPVGHPYPASAERLWRSDACYDLLAVIGYNDDPVIDGAGSAIFLHVARPGYPPTEGCVALALEDLRTVLAGWRPDDRIEIG